MFRSDNDGTGWKEDGKCKYWSITGNIDYLVKNTSPDIIFSLNQCEEYFNNLKLLCDKSLKWVGWYLEKYNRKEIILQPEENGKLKFYVHSDFYDQFNK